MAESGSGLYLDGLLEGHESPGYTWGYKIWMFCFLAFGLFGVAAGPATFNQPRWTVASCLISLALLGLICFTLFLVKNYRVMNMDPVWRKAAFFVMFMCILLASASAVLMHEAFQPLPVPPAPIETTTTTTHAPETPVPGQPVTTMPVPPNTTQNTSSFFFYSSRRN